MEKFKELFFTHKREIIFVSFLLFCLAGFFAFSIIHNKFNAETDVVLEQNIVSEPKEEKLEDKEVEKTFIRVDVKGAVNNPGVYELEYGSRVIDAVNVSGGFREDAYTRYLNLSKKLEDEFIVLINTVSEIDEMKSESLPIVKETPICEVISNVCTNEEKTITNSEMEKTKENTITSNNTNNPNEETSSLININTATLEELSTLEGIGESKAKAIIEYRLQNGPFESIEDIQKVSGIGEKAYEKIKDSIKTP